MADDRDKDLPPALRAVFVGDRDVFKVLANTAIRSVLEQLMTGSKTLDDLEYGLYSRKRLASLLDRLVDIDLVEFRQTGDGPRFYRVRSAGFEPVRAFLERIGP